MKRLPVVASFVLFIALCASVAYWAMQLFKPPLRAVAAPPPATQPAPNLNAAAGLFGGRSTVAVASNYQLKGVVVSGNAADSIAILSADGKPAQAVRANAEVMPGVTVKEVHRQYVLLSEGGVAKRVELPEDAKVQAKTDMSTNVPLPAQPAPAMPPAIVNPPPAAVNPPPEQTNAPGMGGGPNANPAPTLGAQPGTRAAPGMTPGPVVPGTAVTPPAPPRQR